jgi:putative addiction module component (TIGR02574 family)
VVAAVGQAYSRRMANSDHSELLQRALQLPTKERLTLAAELLESVEGSEDGDWSAAWSAELDSRALALERGEVHVDEWEAVERGLRAELSR